MERVSVESIDYNDRTFCISYPVLHDRLVASVKQFGVLSPLILLGPAPYRVVTGFRRLEAARRLDMADLPCFIERMDQREALLLAIHDNLSRPLGVVEKALCIEKMIGAGLEKEPFEAVLKAMSLQANEKIVKLLLALAQSDEAFKVFAARHNVATHELSVLFSFPLETRTMFVSALDPVRLTSSLLREIIELSRLLIIKRGSIPFEELKDLDSGDEVKAALKRKAYPLLSQMEERLKTIKGAMSLPPSIAVATDPYFEKSSMEIRITARNEEEVRESVTKLQLVTDNGDMRSVFDLISGDPTRS